MNRIDRFVLLVSMALVGLVALRAVVEAAAVVAGPGIALGAGYGIYRLCQAGRIGFLRWGRAEEKKL